jgi:polysaccharide export outer membrane protein
MISVPLVKEVEVQGLSPRELEILLTSKLAALIHDPDVSVVVKEVHSEVIYLLGGVKKEGAIPIQGPTTVLQAVARAGGLTDYAKRNKMYVLRQENGAQQKIAIHYESVLKGEHMEQNISLHPGDTIVVPQ